MFVILEFQLVINRFRSSVTNIKNRELNCLCGGSAKPKLQQESSRLLASILTFFCSLLKFADFHTQRKAKTLYFNMLRQRMRYIVETTHALSVLNFILFYSIGNWFGWVIYLKAIVFFRPQIYDKNLNMKRPMAEEFSINDIGNEKVFPLSGNIFAVFQLYNMVMRKNFFKIL